MCSALEVDRNGSVLATEGSCLNEFRQVNVAGVTNSDHETDTEAFVLQR